MPFGGSGLMLGLTAIEVSQGTVFVAQCGEQSRVRLPACAPRRLLFLQRRNRDARMDRSQNRLLRSAVQPVAGGREPLMQLDPEPDPINSRWRKWDRSEAGDVALADLGAGTGRLDQADV